MEANSYFSFNFSGNGSGIDSISVIRTCMIYCAFPVISNPPPPPVPGSDYTGVTEFLKFSSYDTRDCVNIPIATDYLVEDDETFTVKLSSTDDDVTFDVSIGTVIILDDDYVDSKLQRVMVYVHMTPPKQPQLPPSPWSRPNISYMRVKGL